MRPPNISILIKVESLGFAATADNAARFTEIARKFGPDKKSTWQHMRWPIESPENRLREAGSGEKIIWKSRGRQQELGRSEIQIKSAFMDSNGAPQIEKRSEKSSAAPT